MKNYFKDSEFKNFPASPTPAQFYLRENLRLHLNCIRHHIKSPIIITDCFRTLAKYKAMKKNYNPSATSDHFWQQVIPTARQKDRIRYGKYFTYSVGAVDFYTPKLDMEKVFKMVMELFHDQAIDIGQAILETGKYSQWIHLSNNRTGIYDYNFLQRIGGLKQRFLISDDNGKSYRLAA